MIIFLDNSVFSVREKSTMKSLLLIAFLSLFKPIYSQITIHDLLVFKGHIEYKNSTSVKKKNRVSKMNILSTAYTKPNTITRNIITFNREGNIISDLTFNEKKKNIENYFASYDSTGVRILKNKSSIQSRFMRSFANEFIYDTIGNLIEVKSMFKYDS